MKLLHECNDLFDASIKLHNLYVFTLLQVSYGEMVGCDNAEVSDCYYTICIV